MDGKFLADAAGRYLVKGVTYGTFAPDADGHQYPQLARVRADFAQMAAAGINTVRLYTPPREEILDAAAEAGLRAIIGLPWPQHVAFLDDAALVRSTRRGIAEQVRRLGAHPAAMLFGVGNEIPPAVVRWHGRERVERFLRDLARAARDRRPDALLTYVNFPPTEFLDLDEFDVYAVNVYLHREASLRAYLLRLQHLAGHRPLLLAEAGADSLREGEDEQARVTATHVRAAFETGCCGAVAFAWTDEWWRGGQNVEDWKFGLVDEARRPKRALAAVSEAFADAPFAPAVRETWPRVSVVVCAYNAASTLEDCLSSLERLTYPDYEVILVDDGSTDGTPAIAARHPLARVVRVPNGGLSAARNHGLAHATGDIVAYTDADVRVDPDWLTHLVQPMLGTDLVGCGGPNVVPADDPDLAQCVARAPGGPTHVLLDDRIAEHVPGCNMAFRREALQRIGGFNPIYLRAGDDVDVCWRLQAQGGKIGFAPAALVWHHHRASLKAYWRQQVGYGEGEVWLRHQHPDKFAGQHMVWHGRIYSPLPFVRALVRMRMDTGVWGLSAFPSVYHPGAGAWMYLPHSAPWYLLTWLSIAAGLGCVALTSLASAGWLMLWTGLAGLGITLGRCAHYATESDLRGLVGSGRARNGRALWLRMVIAWLHYVQPLARFRGRMRGHLEPPGVPAVAASIPESTARPAPGLRDLWTALRLLGGAAVEDRFWSERWCGVDQVLQRTLEALRLARISRHVRIADGWEQRHDISVALGRWAWFDLATLVEEHSGGRVLVRSRISLRPSWSAVLISLVAFGAIAAATLTSALGAWQGPPAIALVAAGVTALFVGAYKTAAGLAGLRAVAAHALDGLGALPLDDARRAVRFAPNLAVWKYASRTALAGLVVSGALLGGSLLVRETVTRTVRQFERPLPAPAPVTTAGTPSVPRIGLVASEGDLYLADARRDTLRRVATGGADATPASLAPIVLRRADTAAGRLATPGSVAVAPVGDLFIADTESHRVYRVDRIRGTAVLVAGTGGPGFSGDGGPATAATLYQPAAVALDREGNLFIADSGNHRIRRVARRTGTITTVIGGGEGDGDPRYVGDGGPGVDATLSWPTDLAVAPNRDLYVVDTGHNRIRRLDARTGLITTVAGTGVPGAGGDGGPATEARLSSPTGIAIAARRGQVTLYVADASNGRVRVITPDGTINSLALPDGAGIGSPARVAYHPRGYLYVAGPGRDALTAVSLLGPPQPAGAHAPRPPAPARGRRLM